MEMSEVVGAAWLSWG